MIHYLEAIRKLRIAMNAFPSRTYLSLSGSPATTSQASAAAAAIR